MRKLFAEILFIFVFSVSMHAASEDGYTYIYKNVGHREGVINTVCSIYKSAGKDVWIGTDKGLYKYDGFNIRYYDDPILNGVRIHHLATDVEGCIWACTDNGPLRYDPIKDTFEETEVSGSDSVGTVFFCCVVGERTLFGGIGGIWDYDHEEGRMSPFFSTEDDFSFMRFHQVENDKLLCTGHQGLIILDINEGVRVSPSADLGSLDNIFASLIDNEGNIWISEYNEGIKVFDNEGRYITSFTEKNGLSSDVVLSFAIKDSQIWVGTDGGGINIIEDPESSPVVIRHNIADKSSLPANSIRSLHVDPHGNVWAGSVRDGLINIRKTRMRTIQDGFIGYKYGLSNPTVLDIFQESGSRYIWMGTDGEGVNRFDQENGLIMHYPTTYGAKVASIASYDEANLLLSVYSKGLFLFEKNSGEITPLDISNEELTQQMIRMGRTVHLVNENDGGILFLGKEIYRWDKDNEHPVKLKVEDAHHLSDFFFPVKSATGVTYVHDSHNLYAIRPGDDQVKLLTSIEESYINSAFCDSDGMMWIATNDGLMYFNIYSGERNLIQTKLFQSAVAVVKDSKDRIWVGAGNKLFAYLLNDGVFVMMGDSDGALPNEYIGKSTLVSEEDNVFMGGVQGLLYIDRDFSIDRKEKPAVYMSNCIIDGQTIPFDKAATLNIPKGSKTIELIVATEEKDLFRQKRYKYTIKGVINQTYESSSPELVLRPVPPPGVHEVYVSCMTRGGEWTDPELLFSFKVPQVWYKTGWFILLCICFIVLIAAVILVVIISQIEQKNKLDMKERERVAYENKVKFLVNWANELKTPLTLVMAPLKRTIKAMSDMPETSATIGMAYRQAKRVRDSLNVMLDLRKMEEGKSELDLQKYDFNKWVSAASSDFIAESAEHNVKISEILDQRIGEVSFDIRKCNMALDQIIMNAMSLSGPNDVLLLTTSIVNQGYVRVSMSGSGDNFADIDIQKIFSTTGGSTIGVGLSYAKILIELHGGTVGAYRNDMGGITVWFEIPSDLEAECVRLESKGYINEIMGDAVQTVSNEGIDALNYDTSSTKLLLIDDSKELLEFIKTALNNNFAEIFTASSGVNAMELMEVSTPDIIVCDVNMPRGNGYEFCSMIRKTEKYNHIPVILLTTKQESQSTQFSYKVGADGLLNKPFEIDTLYELIRNQLKRKDDLRKKKDINHNEDIQNGSHEESFIAKINKTITDNISNPDLGVEILCKSVGVSRSVLYNKLKMITGVGANEYISRIRIEKAIFLIENTEMSFTEIADKIGMTPNYFSTAFKQHTGYTPTQYKKGRQMMKI